VLSDLPFQDQQETSIFIVDWEVIHMNAGRHFDLGQMAIDLYLLWYVKGIRAALWILEGLTSALKDLDEDLAFRTAIRMGSFLICMMPLMPEWGPPEKIEELIGIGRDIAVHAWNRDRAWFQDSELACLFSRVK
jgi:hypothetical protein